MQEIKITEQEAGQRFDKLLSKYLNKAPKSFLYKMLRKKNITLNGKKASGNEKLAKGDCVKLFLSDETIQKFSETFSGYTNVSLEILYEDEDIILINKPVGMLSQKAARSDESLVEHLISYLIQSHALTEEDLRTFRPSICNRLDRNTSGLVVAGKSLAGLQVMNGVFKDRSLHKYYQCLVNGQVKEKKLIAGFLRKDEAANTVTVYPLEVEDSVPIMTEYLPLAGNGTYTLLQVTLITGRSHQIRAHLASIGHPIVGDYKYGRQDMNDAMKKKYGVRSQLLHSWKLVMPDKLPEPLDYLSGKEMLAGLPDQFARVLKGEGIRIPG